MFFLVAVACVVGLIMGLWRQYANSRDRSKAEYEAALARLRRDPSNTNLRTEVIRLGRAYSSVTRAPNGVSDFDEVALMNDINAACAAAAQPQARVSVEARLNRLAELRQQGLIDDAELAERRRAILTEL